MDNEDGDNISDLTRYRREKDVIVPFRRPQRRASDQRPMRRLNLASGKIQGIGYGRPPAHIEDAPTKAGPWLARFKKYRAVLSSNNILKYLKSSSQSGQVDLRVYDDLMHLLEDSIKERIKKAFGDSDDPVRTRLKGDKDFEDFGDVIYQDVNSGLFVIMDSIRHMISDSLALEYLYINGKNPKMPTHNTLLTALKANNLDIEQMAIQSFHNLNIEVQKEAVWQFFVEQLHELLQDILPFEGSIDLSKCDLSEAMRVDAARASFVLVSDMDPELAANTSIAPPSLSLVD